MIELIDIAMQSSDVVLQEARDAAYAEELKLGLVALAVGLAALGAGYAERGIGAAAVGAMAEDEEMFGRGLIMTVLPETLVIFAIVVIFLV
jgi:V/A-type H+-transporting ATPase subunit K